MGGGAQQVGPPGGKGTLNLRRKRMLMGHKTCAVTTVLGLSSQLHSGPIILISEEFLYLLVF